MERYKSRQQESVAKFQDRLFQGITPDMQLAKLHEEVSEVTHDLNKHGLQHESTAEELTDVIIISLGMLHKAGFDFEELFSRKMAQNWSKYMHVPHYRNGMSLGEAMSHAKSVWEDSKHIDTTPRD